MASPSASVDVSAMPTAAELRARFETVPPGTIGLEEEVMLLDPTTHDLAGVARDVLAGLEGDPRFKLELPASQLEIVTPPCATVPEAIDALGQGRRDLSAATAGRCLPAGGGVHPLARLQGELNDTARYRRTLERHGPAARAQLVQALHVHVAVGGGDRALAVYAALRPWLAALAALGANAPFAAGRDTGLASVRPLIGGLLPRQGVPPELASWEHYAGALAWLARAGAVSSAGHWWWEMRLHPLHATVELRLFDTQVTLRETAAIAAFVHALAHDLAAGHDAGEPVPAAEDWRLAENRWSALRDGLDAPLADLATGEPVPARERLRALADRLAPWGRPLGCSAELAWARTLLEGEGGAGAQRRAAAQEGVGGVPGWLARRFSP
ncbi:MAG TPA: YbdK family carboxylate-amine ligase [Solirubrobacteraceae bacterium]|nr:YbdK family carboxylate-amine ligase [Solirubrobacteraceae bacterium]